jgi:hypothetical protein
VKVINGVKHVSADDIAELGYSRVYAGRLLSLGGDDAVVYLDVRREGRDGVTRVRSVAHAPLEPIRSALREQLAKYRDRLEKLERLGS